MLQSYFSILQTEESECLYMYIWKKSTFEWSVTKSVYSLKTVYANLLSR